MRILIAEDDAVSRLILQKAVEKLGHACLIAVDGTQAWELYQQSSIDVLVSDWMMPGIDGPELCQRVRAHGSMTYTYFIFLTALRDKEYVLSGMQAGADDYLTKPFDRDELAVKLIAAARITALHQQLEAQRAELQRLNTHLFTQAHRDALTGLGNRRQLDEDLATLRERVERYRHRYSVALCDIDAFKQYNDNYGHAAGDEVLRQVAQVMARSCRTGDVAYRYGGEEFLLRLAEQSGALAALAVERLRHAVEGLAIPHRATTPAGVVTISAGVAELLPGEHKSVAAVLQEADAALYRAKKAGRNRVVISDGADGMSIAGGE
jgi:two-component system cell cycle response regulator